MKCPKCGEDCNSGAGFCDACGCDLRESMKKEPRGAKVYSGEENDYFEFKDLQSQDGKRPSKTVKRRKKGEVVSIVITVTLLAIIVLAGIFIYQTLHKEPYEKKLDEIADLINNRTANIDKYGEVFLPDYIWKDFMLLAEAEYEESGKNPWDMKTDYNIQLKSAMDILDDTLGSGYRVEFKVTNARKLGEAELYEIEDSYTQVSQVINVFTESGDMLKDEGKVKSYEAYQKLIDDFTKIEFEEGYELDVVTLMTVGEEETESTGKIMMVKTGDKWMVDFMHNIDELSSLMNHYIH